MIKIILEKDIRAGERPYVVSISIKADTKEEKLVVGRIPVWALETIEECSEEAMYDQLYRQLAFILRKILNTTRPVVWESAVIKIELSK